MEEYTGQLIGGPDDGRLVTASTIEIVVVSSTRLWLDGKEKNKTPAVSVITGVYVWQPVPKYFIWQHRSGYVQKQELQAA